VPPPHIGSSSGVRRLPVGEAQDARREILLERRLTGGLAPPSLEQRLARCIEIEREALRLEERVNAHVRLRSFDVRASSRVGNETIAYRIFDT
jgi:hypothetical protein